MTPPGLWRNHKGNLYVVDRTARNATNASSVCPMVVYWPLSSGPEDTWVRDEAEWHEKVVWPDGDMRPRFVKVGSSDDNEKNPDAITRLLSKVGDMLLARAIERFRSSWSEQECPERKRRLVFIKDMVRELDKILLTTRQATAFCDMAIEALILGDEKDLASAVSLLQFDGEEESYRVRNALVFARFVEIGEDALATWPREGKATA